MDIDGIDYITTADAVIAAGAATVPVMAVIGGAAGNQAAGALLTIQTAIPGLDGTATVGDAGLTGGTDTEADSALLARFLDRIQQPPAGGNAHDYETWALSVAGVAWAKCLPLRQGLGTVTVLVLTSGSGADRIPGPDLVAAVQTFIDGVRPVCDKYFQALAPTAHSVDISVNLSYVAGYDPTTVQGWITTALTAFMGTFNPLDTLKISKLEAVISDVEGVADAVLVDPAANVVPVDDLANIAEMITLGGVTFGAL